MRVHTGDLVLQSLPKDFFVESAQNLTSERVQSVAGNGHPSSW